MRIAIIGTGVSGLVAARLLHASHEITLFESSARPGGHANTVRIDLDDEVHDIDTGFIVFNSWTYPHFIRLLNELGVASQPTTMGFSVRDDASGLEYAGQSVTSLFAQRRNLLRPRFYRMLFDIVRFYREALRREYELSPEMTVEQFVASGGYSREFKEWHLLPMGAAIWSCPPGTFARFPIRFIIEFYKNHGLLNLVRRPTWSVVAGGSQMYVDALISPFRQRIQVNSPVVAVRRTPDEVALFVKGHEPRSFDHVIFACHSDQALRILGSGATSTEREVLAKLPYGRNTAILHTDISMLPKNRRAWASWNYRVTADETIPACVTYNMNILQGLRSRNTFCVTLNGDAHIDPSRILRRFEYHHPIFTTDRDAAQSRHSELLAANRTSFCGAYWRNGFHEDGVTSALAVVNALKSLPSHSRTDHIGGQIALAGANP